MNKLTTWGSILLLVSFILSCKSLSEPSQHSGASHKAIEVIVGNEKVNCTGVAPQMCYLVKLKQEDEWQNYYSEIDGFDYEEGYEYLIKVKVENVSNSYQDASDVQYKLIEVISKTEKQIHISPLYDTWGLLELNGKKVDIGRLDRSPMLDINTRKKKIMASTGCNSFSTTIDYNDERGYFKVDFPLAITTVACSDYSIESEYLKAMEKINSYMIKGPDLYFKKDDEVLFHFRKVD